MNYKDSHKCFQEPKASYFKSAEVKVFCSLLVKFRMALKWTFHWVWNFIYKTNTLLINING